MPPTAPIIGNIACFKEDNSPCKNSLFISNVTKKKKIAINASFIQCNTLSFKPKLLIPTKTYSFSELKYIPDKLELLTIKAIIALIKSNIPLAASNLKNQRNADEI